MCKLVGGFVFAFFVACFALLPSLGQASAAIARSLATGFTRVLHQQRPMWLLVQYSGSASIEARPTALAGMKHAGTSSRWVHAVQTTDSSNSLEVFVPPGKKVVTPAGARATWRAESVGHVTVHRVVRG